MTQDFRSRIEKHRDQIISELPEGQQALAGRTPRETPATSSGCQKPGKGWKPA